MECPICFEIIENSGIGPCMHHYCYKCLIKWISFGGIQCPSCKQTIYEIRMDKEFDLINNPNNINILIEQSFSIIKSKSFNSPLTLITIACLASDLLIFSATSKPVTLLGKFKLFPSGNVIIGI